MPEITIEEGNTERIIPDDQAGANYVLSVTEGTISMGHSERYAREGRKYNAGASGHLSRLQDGHERSHMWVHAHTDATIDVRRDGFFFDLFNSEPRETREVSRPKDRAQRNRDLTYISGSAVVSPGASEFVIDEVNETEETQWVETAAFSPNGTDPGQWRVIIQIDDDPEGFGSIVWRFDQHGAGYPFNWDPAMPWDPGHALQVRIRNNTSTEEQGWTNVLTRGEL